MIKFKEIAFTAYAVTNMAKAKKFYEGVLGLKRSRVFSKNFIEYDIGKSTLVVACAPKLWFPSKKGTAVAIEVADFEAAVEHFRAHKIKFAIPPQYFPICSMFGVRDPDGNMLTFHKRKKK
ncbi:VOC family protein [Oleiharenicola lentus]|uniref:VOC family protein n=1 Tax=Oleiharenicola lentus TaxID=2508720 RepID=UPI003F66FC83